MTPHSSPTCTAFAAHRVIATGPVIDVARKVKEHSDRHPTDAILVFDDATAEQVEFDLRGTPAEVSARVQSPAATEPDADVPRTRGRPRLGVVAREITLLPRHWQWLAAQPGGASVALRKLVDQARRANGDGNRSHAARDAAYHFMSAMAGNLPGFEEAARALFASDRQRFVGLIAAWPQDIRDHVVELAFADSADPPVA